MNCYQCLYPRPHDGRQLWIKYAHKTTTVLCFYSLIKYETNLMDSLQQHRSTQASSRTANSGAFKGWLKSRL